MVKLGTVTVSLHPESHNRHIRVLRDTPGIYLDLVKTGVYFRKYVVTDGEWNPANEDGERVYEDGGWKTVEKSR